MLVSIRQFSLGVESQFDIKEMGKKVARRVYER